MAAISSDHLIEVTRVLYVELYEAEFGGLRRGRFVLSREQMKRILQVSNLHSEMIESLARIALNQGLAIIDLDDAFACIETSVLRGYRRVPNAVLDQSFDELLADVSSMDDEDHE